MAPLDQEAQNSKSTCLLRQGTEMVNVAWPLGGAGTRPGGEGRGVVLLTALEKAVFHCPVVLGGASRVI